MNLEQLRGFTTIARVGHFTRAAEALHLSQPSLSRQISTLEHDLGTTLVNRTRGNLTLTAAGRALLPLATRMLADAESIRVEMAELAGLRRGRVRLGAPPTLCVSLVAEVLETYRATYPGIELQISEAGSRTLLEQLTGGQLDLVPQIAFSPSYDLRAATQSAYRTLGLSPNVVIDGGEMDAVLRFVQVGLGVAIVPATALVGRSQLHGRALRSSARKDRRRPSRCASCCCRPRASWPSATRRSACDLDTQMVGQLRR